MPATAQVSILVVMESAQEGQDRAGFSGMWYVSILVVMESAQEEDRAEAEANFRACFNPCCNGKCSGSGPT